MSDLFTTIPTADGSYTVKSSHFGESMHTDAGAYEESVIKHVRACGRIVSGSKTLDVLDVGFGIGYNLCALLEVWSCLERRPPLRIVSLEMDRSVSSCFSELRFNDGRDRWYDLVKIGFIDGHLEGDGFTMTFLYGDARKSVSMLASERAQFDIVFQDAFSPGKNPELWSLDYFHVIRNLMKSDAVLTTYSAAPQIRRAMAESGLKIARGVSTGKKKEGTIASPSPLENQLTDGEMKELFSEIKGTPYRDENLDADRERILARRIDEMAEIRKDRRSSQCHPARRE